MPFSLVIFSMAFAVSCTAYNFLDVKPIDLYGLPLTAAFMLVAVSYIISDCITELFGRKIMMKVLISTIIMHLVVICFSQLGCSFTPSNDWELNDAYLAIIGQSPKVALLSAFAFLCGTTTNTLIMSFLKYLWKDKYFKARAFLSTIAGEFIDCCAYLPIMFWGVLPFSEIWDMIVLFTTSKCIIEAVVLPITHRVVNYFKNDHNSLNVLC